MAKSDHTGKRKRREDARKRVPKLGYYIIVTDTDKTERYYMLGFRDSLPVERKNSIVITVAKAETEGLVATCKNRAAMHPQYSEPWIMFDRDRVENFDEIIADAESEGIRVAWSNPCIEVWFSAYFGDMLTYSGSKECCEKFGEEFKRKTGKEYDKADSQIYTLLNKYGDERKAIDSAETRLQGYLNDGLKSSEMCPGTTVYTLIKEIRGKTQKT